MILLIFRLGMRVLWSDGVSRVDMLAYEPYAKLVYNIAISDRLNPITIGLFGNWGSGKSTLLNLVERKIKEEGQTKKIIPIMVNAWMFEGYDDAKTALMDSILRAIDENELIGDECKKGIANLIKKVDWIRVGRTLAKKGIPVAMSLMTGNPLPAIFSSLEAIKNIDLTDEGELRKISGNISKLKDFVKEDEEKQSIIENIRTFRIEFEELLNYSSIDNLIIMIDDLDRCTPDRVLETLEAIKLFLSVNNTTFIIAMDEDVINYSIKRKYPQLSEDIGIDISKDYIEKIVQLPINLPELSEIDIENYILLLICEMFLKEQKLSELIEKLKDLEIFTKGEIISSKDIYDNLNVNEENENEFFKESMRLKEFENQIEIFSSISSIISHNLKGNPRQAKRFLNKFYVRKKLSDIQNIHLDLAILAKLMVLEYSNIELFKKLYVWQFENQGIAAPLEKIEEMILNEKEDESMDQYKEWLKEDVKRWFFVEPTDLSKKDLRQYFYLARESVREKDISMLNIGLEERRRINDICKEDVDSSVIRRKIEELKEIHPNKTKEIIKGVVSKYQQDNSKHIKLLIYIYEYLEEYREQMITELKKFKHKLKPNEIILFGTIKQIEPNDCEKLKNYFIESKKTKEEIWDKIVK